MQIRASVLYQIIMQFINNKLDMTHWNNIRKVLINIPLPIKLL